MYTSSFGKLCLVGYTFWRPSVPATITHFSLVGIQCNCSNQSVSHRWVDHMSLRLLFPSTFKAVHSASATTLSIALHSLGRHRTSVLPIVTDFAHPSTASINPDDVSPIVLLSLIVIFLCSPSTCSSSSHSKVPCSCARDSVCA